MGQDEFGFEDGVQMAEAAVDSAVQDAIATVGLPGNDRKAWATALFAELERLHRARAMDPEQAFDLREGQQEMKEFIQSYVAPGAGEQDAQGTQDAGDAPRRAASASPAAPSPALGAAVEAVDSLLIRGVMGAGVGVLTWYATSMAGMSFGKRVGATSAASVLGFLLAKPAAPWLSRFWGKLGQVRQVIQNNQIPVSS